MSTLTLPDGAVYTTSGPEAPETAWDGLTTAQTVVKSVDELRYTLSVGYPADMADIQKSRDGHRDFATAAEVEKAAWDYMRGERKVGLFHENGTEGAGEIVESYIYRGPDWPQDDGSVVKSGDWLIGTIWSEPVWEAIKNGDIRGTSMQGRVTERRKPTPNDVARAKARSRGN